VDRLAPRVREIEEAWGRLRAAQDAVRSAAGAQGTLLAHFDEFVAAETAEASEGDAGADLERLRGELEAARQDAWLYPFPSWDSNLPPGD
jgi:hypothetical protein